MTPEPDALIWSEVIQPVPSNMGEQNYLARIHFRPGVPPELIFTYMNKLGIILSYDLKIGSNYVDVRFIKTNIEDNKMPVNLNIGTSANIMSSYTSGNYKEQAEQFLNDCRSLATALEAANKEIAFLDKQLKEEKEKEKVVTPPEPAKKADDYNYWYWQFVKALDPVEAADAKNNMLERVDLSLEPVKKGSSWVEEPEPPRAPWKVVKFNNSGVVVQNILVGLLLIAILFVMAGV